MIELDVENENNNKRLMRDDNKKMDGRLNEDNKIKIRVIIESITRENDITSFEKYLFIEVNRVEEGEEDVQRIIIIDRKEIEIFNLGL